MDLWYYSYMPTGKNTKQVTAIVTIDEYQRLKNEVYALQHEGRKVTMSRYIARVLREHWKAQDLFKANGFTE
jgi:hypothetical protein